MRDIISAFKFAVLGGVLALPAWGRSDMPAAPVQPAVHVSTAIVTSSTATWRVVLNTAFGTEEDLRYVISWGVVTGGYSTLNIRGLENINGRMAYHIVSDADSTGLVDTFYHVHDRNEAWLDQESLTTVRYEKHIREGKYRVEAKVTMDQVNHTYEDNSYRVDKDRYEVKSGTLPVNALDVLGSLYYVRTLPLALGESYSIDVYSNGKVFPLIVNVKKRQKIRVPAGKFDCFMVEPLLREPGIFVSKGKKLYVWLTADDRRIPVRMRSEVVIGHVAADLVNYRRPDSSKP